MFELLKNVAATGGIVLVARGEYCFSTYGTFSGATLTLQRQMGDGATFVNVGTDAIMTAPGMCIADLPGGLYRVLVSGGTPSGLYATLDLAENS